MRWFCSSRTPSHPGPAVEPGSAPGVPHYWVDPNTLSPLRPGSLLLLTLPA